MKAAKILIPLFVVLVALVLGYSRILQSHADENGRLFDDRCNNVNPKLIAYKNAYLEIVDTIRTEQLPEGKEPGELLDDYTDGIREYLPLEEAWLKKQRAWLSRWDVRLFQPEYVRELGEAQTEMYQAYYDHAKSVVDQLDGPQKPASPEEAERLEEAKEKYFRLFDEASLELDWRKFLWKAPEINCPEENLTIPDTYGIIDRVLSPSPSPTDRNRDLEKLM